MACLYPSTIVNPHYVKYPNELIGDVFPHDYYITIGCGKCPLCRKAKASSWRFRLLQEVRYNPHSYFVTLTFSPRYYERFKSDPGRALRLFLERYRKRYGKSLRHWFVTELGDDNGRLHFHGIIVNPVYSPPIESFKRLVLKRIGRNKYGKFLTNDGEVKRFNRWLRRFWQYGNTWVDVVRPETCSYIVKYMLKPCKYDPYFVSKVFCSNGLGSDYVKDISVVSTILSNNSPIIQYDGNTFSLPLYFVRKIFSEEQRKKNSFEHWLRPPPYFSQFLLGIEYKNEDSYNSRLSMLREEFEKNAPYYVKTYRCPLPPRWLVESTFATDDSLYIDAMFRTLNNIKFYE